MRPIVSAVLPPLARNATGGRRRHLAADFVGKFEEEANGVRAIGNVAFGGFADRPDRADRFKGGERLRAFLDEGRPPPHHADPFARCGTGPAAVPPGSRGIFNGMIDVVGRGDVNLLTGAGIGRARIILRRVVRQMSQDGGSAPAIIFRFSLDCGSKCLVGRTNLRQTAIFKGGFPGGPASRGAISRFHGDGLYRGEKGPALQIRDMTADDLAPAHALSLAASWPHRLEDWKFLFRLGCGVVAQVDDEIVGTAMGWRYGDNAAALGMVIVAQGHQGKGIGRQLMGAIVERLSVKTLVLNSTPQGTALYSRSGFEDERVIHQHQGAAFGVPVVALRPDERIRPMGRADHDALIALDHEATGLPRAALMSELLKKGKWVVLDRNDRPAGFATFRRFGRGYVIGPVVAPDQNSAKALISHWLGSNAGMFTRLDIPAESGLCEWLNNLGVVHVDQVAGMVAGPALVRGTSVRTYSLVNQALG